MATLQEMSVEYRVAAAKMRLYIERLKSSGADPCELKQCQQILRQIRDTSRLLSGYYDVPRTSENAAVGWTARRTRDDH